MPKYNRSNHKTFALWLVLILVFASLFRIFDQKEVTANHIRYSEFVNSVRKGEVESVLIQSDDRILGNYKKPKNGKKAFETIGRAGSYEFLFPMLDEHKIIWENKAVEKTPFWQQALLNWFPILLIALIFLFFIRQIQIGGGKAMNFGRSKAKLLNESSKKVTFKDVAGVEEAKAELKEIIDFLKDPKKFTRLGGRIPKGVLLIGPPGTGKTLLVRAIAGEAGVPFFSISGSDFVEMFVGVGASRVRDLFEQGKKFAPCIVFIDEIDAVGRQRGAGLGGGHDEREQTLNQLLVEMDGFDSTEGVILVAATNRPDVLDPALLRPGRFDRRVVVNKPDVRGREKILAVHSLKTPLSGNVNLNTIAKGTPGFSGADLANLVNEAALEAASRNKKKLEMEDFEYAKDKVLMGVERRSMVISEEEKRNTAYHESGHTIVGKLLPGTDPVHKVTIIPRGMALGLTQTLPNEDRLSYSKEHAENMIAFLMGGRAAEEIIFSKKTTGAGNDIERASEIARKMVCEWGMSVKLGPISYTKKNDQVFLGREFNQAQTYSQATAEIIDQEVHSIMEKNYKRAHELLTGKVEVLHNMAKALLIHETLDTKQIDALMEGKKLNIKAGSKSKKDSTTEEEKKLTAEGKSKKTNKGSSGLTDSSPVTV